MPTKSRRGRSHQLPYSDRAIIPREKLSDYLLSGTHPVGSAKAKFFRGYGFNDDNVELLEEGILLIARSKEVQEATETPFGVKYVIDGPLQTPAGPVVRLRTVWIIEKGKTDPRFVTAHPG